jgi:hypothetical protein
VSQPPNIGIGCGRVRRPGGPARRVLRRRRDGSGRQLNAELDFLLINVPPMSNSENLDLGRYYSIDDAVFPYAVLSQSCELALQRRIRIRLLGQILLQSIENSARRRFVEIRQIPRN